MKNTAIAFVLFVLLGAHVYAQQNQNQPPDLPIDAATRAQIINDLTKELNESYVFPDTAKKMEESVKAKLQNKDYDAITSAREFAEKLTADLQAVSRDKHLRVRFSFNKIPVRQERREPSKEEIEERKLSMRRTNFGFERIERLPGNIGYVELLGFSDAEAGAETVAAAMNFLQNTDALIFDLRRNGGGSPEMVALISSYLFGEKPVHLNSLYWRKGDKTEEFWTKSQIAGKRYGETKDVYVLTSNRTFSAGEEFTYNLKNLKRATIIGETTGGGAHPGGMFRINDHFGAFVPTGRAINPISKTNWEGTGVEPDVKVSKELALKTAQILALNKIIERTPDEQRKKGLREIVEETQKEIAEMKNKETKTAAK
jgi:retinol-binding protein 3